MGPHQHQPRSRSPEREHKRRRHRSRSPRPRPAVLPLNARELSRHDLRTYRPMFALYLDIQKQIDIEELDEGEVKGRWKSFVNKWNRGELAQGWYDSSTLTKAIAANEATRKDRRSPLPTQVPPNPSDPRPQPTLNNEGNSDDDDDGDDFGPALPSHNTLIHTSSSTPSHHPSQGPTAATTDDMRAHHENLSASDLAARQSAQHALRLARASERILQSQRLDELAPRAAPGSRERQLEKRRETAASNSAFAAASHEAGDADVKDEDVMGDADSLGELKRMKKEHERKKNERELRREEMLRARRAEREARLAVVREKEEKTVEMLRELARARFGGGGTATEGGG